MSIRLKALEARSRGRCPRSFGAERIEAGPILYPFARLVLTSFYTARCCWFPRRSPVNRSRSRKTADDDVFNVARIQQFDKRAQVLRKHLWPDGIAESARAGSSGARPE